MKSNPLHIKVHRPIENDGYNTGATYAAVLTGLTESLLCFSNTMYGAPEDHPKLQKDHIFMQAVTGDQRIRSAIDDARNNSKVDYWMLANNLDEVRSRWPSQSKNFILIPYENESESYPEPTLKLRNTDVVLSTPELARGVEPVSRERLFRCYAAAAHMAPHLLIDPFFNRENKVHCNQPGCMMKPHQTVKDLDKLLEERKNIGMEALYCPKTTQMIISDLREMGHDAKANPPATPLAEL